MLLPFEFAWSKRHGSAAELVLVEPGVSGSNGELHRRWRMKIFYELTGAFSRNSAVLMAVDKPVDIFKY
ncbi:hypothetical protein EVC45_39420 [Paraburkholderia sp. UYCP14C]|nr:hypothetical protein EVC45_39420 [Paraburkholderia sp. UYCP14C]